MPERALQVQVLLVTAMQQDKGHDVHDKPGNGDAHKDIAHHGFRGHQPLDGLGHDPDRKQQQGNAIDESRENLEPRPAETAMIVGRPFGQFEAEPGKSQRASVGQHMCGICQKGERTGDDTADHLGNHEREGQKRGNRNTLAGILGITDRMMVAVSAVSMSV